MPSWLEDSECQRAEWFNMILTKLWPHISEATDQKMKNMLQPRFSQIVANLRLDHVASLKLEKFLLGEICPKIKSIRVHNTHESTVRIDSEFAWAGNPEIVILLGLGDKLGIPELPIEVCDFRLSMNLRIELKNLMNTFPCFRSVCVTCMKPPFVDLSCKLGTLNLTNIGLGNLNIRELIMSIISSSINSMMLFPNKFEMAMTDDNVVTGEVVPEGLLQLTIVRGVNLKVADYFTSDPYIVVYGADKELGRTKVIYETLNPVWEESFDILVFDKATQEVKLKIFDFDLIGIHDDMGYCNIKTDYISVGMTQQMELPVCGAVGQSDIRGTIIVELNYVALACTDDKHRGHVAEDESFLLDLPDFLHTSLEFIEEEVISDILTANSIGTESALDSLLYGKHRHSTDRSSRESKNAPAKGRNNVLESATKSKRGVLTITSIRCENLKALPSMVEFLVPSALKCCVRFEADGKRKETKVVCNHKDPNFNESFSFVIEDPVHSTLVINVIDKADIFNDRVMGFVEVEVNDYLEHSAEKEYLLEGKNEECRIFFKATWYAISVDKKRGKRI